jgi:hypothetical protein
MAAMNAATVSSGYGHVPAQMPQLPAQYPMQMQPMQQPAPVTRTYMPPMQASAVPQVGMMNSYMGSQIPQQIPPSPYGAMAPSGQPVGAAPMNGTRVIMGPAPQQPFLQPQVQQPIQQQPPVTAPQQWQQTPAQGMPAQTMPATAFNYPAAGQLAPR